MELIPKEELKNSSSFNFAPMIDFLFLMLALFAVLAVSRSALLDTEVSLVQLQPEAKAQSVRSKAQMQTVHLSITADGNYKWITEFQEYPMENAAAIQEELTRQHNIGALPQEKQKTEILVHIDKQAKWAPIAQLIFSVREVGFNARPVYESLEK